MWDERRFGKKNIYLDENLMKRIKPTQGERNKRVID
jgi:hypothetical protein